MSKKGKNDMKPGDAQGKEAQQEQQPLAVFEKKLKGHTGWVNSVAVSSDGEWAASGSSDTTIKIWDLESDQCRATLATPKCLKT